MFGLSTTNGLGRGVREELLIWQLVRVTNMIKGGRENGREYESLSYIFS